LKRCRNAEWIWILDLDLVGFKKKYENIEKIWISFGFDLDFRVFHQILLLYGFDLLFEKHIWIWICPNPTFLSNPEHCIRYNKCFVDTIWDYPA